MSLLEWGEAWSDANARHPGLQPFPSTLAERVRQRGQLPVISWGSYAAGGGTDQPAFRLQRIIDGAYDRFIRAWASAAAAWAHPLLLRFDWEMNGTDSPYSEAANGNHAGQFVPMWRHVHALFAAEGATNVQWVWNPDVGYAGSIPLDRLYPGDNVVDWVGLDGYNWGRNPARPNNSWRRFGQVFGSALAELQRLAPNKPVLIGETASTEYGGSKAAWITGAFRAIVHDFPSLRGVVWFNKNADGMDWVVQSSRSATDAFARAIADPAFVAGAGSP
jgi:beta-mannanase